MASREERIESYYHESAWTLSERIVDLEDALKEAKADSSYFEEWATANGHRLNASLAERSRYRLAWLSARRRAADEANMGQEAVDHIRRDRDRWRSGHETAEAQLVWQRRENARLRAEVDGLRKTTDGTRLEYAGEDDEGEVWRLVGPPAQRVR